MTSGSLLGVVSLGPTGPPLSWQGGSRDYSNFLDKDLRVTRHLSQRFWPLVHGFGEGNGTSLQYSCVGDPMDRGAWWATVHGVAKGQTRPHD